MDVKIVTKNLQQEQLVSGGEVYPANEVSFAQDKPGSILNSTELPLNLDSKKAVDEQNAKKQTIESQIKALISELKGKPSEERSKQILQEIQSLAAGSGTNVSVSSLVDEAKNQFQSNITSQQAHASAALEKEIKGENNNPDVGLNNIINDILEPVVVDNLQNDNKNAKTDEKTDEKTTTKSAERQIKKSEAVKKASETVVNKFKENYGKETYDLAIQQKDNILDTLLGESVRKQVYIIRREEQLKTSDDNFAKFKEGKIAEQAQEIDTNVLDTQLKNSGVSSVESADLLSSLKDLNLNNDQRGKALASLGDKPLEGKDLLNTLRSLNLAPSESRNLINKISEKQQEKELKTAGVVDGRDLIDSLYDLDLSRGKLDTGEIGSRIDIVKDSLKNNLNETLEGNKLSETLNKLGLTPEERASVIKKLSEKSKEKEVDDLGLAALFGEAPKEKEADGFGLVSLFAESPSVDLSAKSSNSKSDQMPEGWSPEVRKGVLEAKEGVQGLNNSKEAGGRVDIQTEKAVMSR